ncbi:MAG: ribonuclease R, partial [Chitinophagaceae bacterium]|nr:ribonuclease R [Chitinophagaceae bacterium]
MGRKNAKKVRGRSNEGAGTTYKGTLDVTRSGMGFVIVPDMKVDIIIRPGDFNTALHGDTVLVRIKNNAGGRRLQGEIYEVVNRKRVEFVGHIEISKDFAFFVPEMDKPIPDFYIPLSSIGDAKDKDRVVARLVKWEPGGKKPLGEIIGVLDPENTNDAA